MWSRCSVVQTPRCTHTLQPVCRAKLSDAAWLHAACWWHSKHTFTLKACNEDVGHTRMGSLLMLQTPEERDISSIVQAGLEAAVQLDKFPKANVDVYCLVLESGGSDTALALTAASLALADAGIEMYDLVAACKVVSQDIFYHGKPESGSICMSLRGGLIALLHPSPCRYMSSQDHPTQCSCHDVHTISWLHVCCQQCACCAFYPCSQYTAILQSRVGGELLLDPTTEESYHEDGAVLMAMMPNANLVSYNATSQCSKQQQAESARHTERFGIKQHCILSCACRTQVTCTGTDYTVPSALSSTSSTALKTSNRRLHTRQSHSCLKGSVHVVCRSIHDCHACCRLQDRYLHVMQAVVTGLWR